MTIFGLSNLKGRWHSVGYGWILEFNQDGYKLYDAIGPIYILIEQGDLSDFLASYDRIEWHGSHDFNLHQRGDITRYHFQAIPENQDNIEIIQPGQSGDPQFNFDILCEIFARHYTFFSLRNIDWPQVCGQYCREISPDFSQIELLEVFKHMLLPLNDGHVSLCSDIGNITIRGHQELRQSLKKTFHMPTHYISPRSTIDSISDQIPDIILHPFSHDIKKVNTACNDIITWCQLGPDIGYLNILRLFGFADSEQARNADDLPHDRQDIGPFLEQDIQALNSALDGILEDFKSVKAVILDIRINGGGFDRAAMTIANRFADAKHLAFRKKARAGNSFTEYQDFFITPEGPSQFTRPVYMMTSPFCLSAGEIFVLCMNALPHVTSVGENSMGMLSDNLNKHLPNGWKLSLSNEIYEAPDGSVYEGDGIPPDIKIKTLDQNHFAKILQQALLETVKMVRCQCHA